MPDIPFHLESSPRLPEQLAEQATLYPRVADPPAAVPPEIEVAVEDIVAIQETPPVIALSHSGQPSLIPAQLPEELVKELRQSVARSSNDDAVSSLAYLLSNARS